MAATAPHRAASVGRSTTRSPDGASQLRRTQRDRPGGPRGSGEARTGRRAARRQPADPHRPSALVPHTATAWASPRPQVDPLQGGGERHRVGHDEQAAEQPGGRFVWSGDAKARPTVAKASPLRPNRRRACPRSTDGLSAVHRRNQDQQREERHHCLGGQRDCPVDELDLQQPGQNRPTVVLSNRVA